FLRQKYFDQAIHLAMSSNFQERNITALPTFRLLGPTPFEQFIRHFLCKSILMPFDNLQTNKFPIIPPI
ncbi:hypothetical protein, partial [Escherichia coli]|uniref:hypothetical protein n=1 Tax=Escherichia coli TaxID=562 RepID=UPI003B75D446